MANEYISLPLSAASSSNITRSSDDRVMAIAPGYGWARYDRFQGDLNWKTAISGGTLSYPGPTVGDHNHGYYMRLNSGTTLNGYAEFIMESANWLYIGQNEIELILNVYIFNAPSATFDYRLIFGLNNNSAGSLPTDGVYIYCDKDSANWVGAAVSSSTTTTQELGAVNDASWHQLRFRINASSSVTFWLDGTQAASTIESNIPTNTATRPYFGIKCLSSSTARDAYGEGFFMSNIFATENG